MAKGSPFLYYGTFSLFPRKIRRCTTRFHSRRLNGRPCPPDRAETIFFPLAEVRETIYGLLRKPHVSGSGFSPFTPSLILEDVTIFLFFAAFGGRWLFCRYDRVCDLVYPLVGKDFLAALAFLFFFRG